MKNVFLVLILITGFASGVAAQTCKPANCAPCPPGSCIINCCTSKATASLISTSPNSVVSPAFYSNEEVKASCQMAKMSRKEIKSCIAACKASSISTVANFQPLQSCQPTPACKAAASTAVVIPATTNLNLQKS